MTNRFLRRDCSSWQIYQPISGLIKLRRELLRFQSPLLWLCGKARRCSFPLTLPPITRSGQNTSATVEDSAQSPSHVRSGSNKGWRTLWKSLYTGTHLITWSIRSVLLRQRYLTLSDTQATLWKSRWECLILRAAVYLNNFGLGAECVCKMWVWMVMTITVKGETAVRPTQAVSTSHFDQPKKKNKNV